MQCFNTHYEIVSPDGFKPTYTYSTYPSAGTTITIPGASNPITLTQGSNPIPNSVIQRTEQILSTSNKPLWFPLPFAEFESSESFCPLNTDPNRYVLSDNPTDASVGITNTTLMEYVDCAQPCRTITIKHHHLLLQNVTLQFYSHVDLPLINDVGMMMNPYHKHVSVAYNISKQTQHRHTKQ